MQYTDQNIPPEIIQEVKLLLTQMKNAKSAEDQVVTENAIREMGYEGALAIHHLLQPEIERLAFRKSRWRWFGLPPIFCFVFFVLVVIINPMLPNAFQWVGFLAFPLFWLGFINVRKLFAGIKIGVPVEIQGFLLCEDKRLIPLIMDMLKQLANVLTLEVMLISAHLTRALTNLLPLLKEEDADLLSAEHRSQLNRSLESADEGNSDVESITAILKAIEQVGDHTSLLVVQHLIKFAPQSGIKQAAKECLPVLQARIDSQGQILLHPSMKPEIAKEELVRPVLGTADPAPEQLLRGSSRDEKE